MKYLIKQKDGSVSVMVTTSPDVLPEDEIKKWPKEVQENVELIIKAEEESDIPHDRYFRNAWAIVDNKISIDMPKAIEIHLDNLREIRKPILESLDVEFSKAVEENNEAAKFDIVSKKNKLRDVTKLPQILNSKTPEELKSFIPEILK